MKKKILVQFGAGNIGNAVPGIFSTETHISRENVAGSYL